jgi:hypothetical protein
MSTHLYTLPTEARARIVLAKLETIQRAAEKLEPGAGITQGEIVEYIRDEAAGFSVVETEGLLGDLHIGARLVLGES